MNTIIAITIVLFSCIGCAFLFDYWVLGSRKSLKSWVRDFWIEEETPEHEAREAYYKDITRISLLIDNAYRPAQWRAVQEEIHLFSLMFTSYKDTKDIIEKWRVTIKDKRTQIGLQYRNEPNDFN